MLVGIVRLKKFVILIVIFSLLIKQSYHGKVGRPFVSVGSYFVSNGP